MDYGTITEDEWNGLPKKTRNNDSIDIEDMRVKFWSHVYKWGDKCWLWAGPMRTYYHENSLGRRWIYRLQGSFNYRGNTYVAYRVAYELEVGNIPEGREIHHKCNESLCVRPEHLEAISCYDHLNRHHGSGRHVPAIIRAAMEQLAEEKKNPELYTKEQKTRRWAYLRYHFRHRTPPLLPNRLEIKRSATTRNIVENER